MRIHLPKYIFAFLFTLISHLGFAQLDLTLTVTQQPTCADPTGGMITAEVTTPGVPDYTFFIVSIPPGYQNQQQ